MTQVDALHTLMGHVHLHTNTHTHTHIYKDHPASSCSSRTDQQLLRTNITNDWPHNIQQIHTLWHTLDCAANQCSMCDVYQHMYYTVCVCVCVCVCECVSDVGHCVCDLCLMLLILIIICLLTPQLPQHRTGKTRVDSILKNTCNSDCLCVVAPVKTWLAFESKMPLGNIFELGLEWGYAVCATVQIRQKQTGLLCFCLKYMMHVVVSLSVFLSL